ncbi:hypothetical protein LV84_00140 [Algoriphagus ratkowskyi]|uniref:Phosphatidate cytidylyltransferase n=1 Tax=Algoriphagus ratkowskyi TaxID=57028 RepID=A0A2W7TCZ4_9BACT|nr:hypothetical protein [Algoriphagus ratkowskyi]PZX61152.1 hypothetical protein LV84_00140 [Algoriphagus ratkowskyi]
MKNHLTQAFVFLVLMITMTGCSVVGDIFEAGLWVGVIIVVLVIAIVFWVIKKLFK